MNTQKRHPRWWQLGLLAPLMMGLLLMDVHMRLSPLEHQIIEVGVVLLMYGRWPAGSGPTKPRWKLKTLRTAAGVRWI